MRLSLLLSVNLLLLAGTVARAQTADDYFNSGAHCYISNNIPDALGWVEKGLNQYPQNVKLKKLYQLLKQQSPRNRPQQKKSSRRPQQTASSGQRQHQSAAQKKEQQEQSQAQRQKRRQAQEQHARPSTKPPKAKAEPKKSSQGQGGSSGTMTRQEAKELLNAQKGNEQFLTLKPPKKPATSRQSIENW